MTKSLAGLSAIALASLLSGSNCHAQSMVVGSSPAPNYYAAPGYYGTMYGTASYKVPLRYSVYPSPFGANYALGYAPSGYVQGPYGAGLWQPGVVNRPGFGSSTYSTFTTVPGPGVVPPPFGYYAPGYGPGPYTLLNR